MPKTKKIVDLLNFKDVNDEFIRQNIINIYSLAAKVEKIENRVLKKVS